MFSYARDQAKLELFGALPSDAVGRVMQRYWTSFALTGDPNSRRWNDDRIEADPWEPVSDLAQPYIAFTGRGGESTLDGMRRSFCPSR